jgi:hypothetical protein
MFPVQCQGIVLFAEIERAGQVLKDNIGIITVVVQSHHP